MSGPLIPAAWTRPAGIAAASTLWLSGNDGAGAFRGDHAPAPERRLGGRRHSLFLFCRQPPHKAGGDCIDSVEFRSPSFDCVLPVRVRHAPDETTDNSPMNTPSVGEKPITDQEAVRAFLPHNGPKLLARLIGVSIETARSWYYRNLSKARRVEIARALLARLDEEDRRLAPYRKHLQEVAGSDEVGRAEAGFDCRTIWGATARALACDTCGAVMIPHKRKTPGEEGER